MPNTFSHTYCSALFLILMGEDKKGSENFPWPCPLGWGQNAWVTSGYASCHDWPVHLGMSSLELFFLCMFSWEQAGGWGRAQKCLSLAQCGGPMGLSISWMALGQETWRGCVLSFDVSGAVSAAFQPLEMLRSFRSSWSESTI